MHNMCMHAGLMGRIQQQQKCLLGWIRNELFLKLIMLCTYRRLNAQHVHACRIDWAQSTAARTFTWLDKKRAFLEADNAVYVQKIIYPGRLSQPVRVYLHHCSIEVLHKLSLTLRKLSGRATFKQNVLNCHQENAGQNASTCPHVHAAGCHAYLLSISGV
jgi:hypothetical protein